MTYPLPTAFVVALIWLLYASSPAIAETGLASWYTAPAGRLMANGKPFNPNAATCARRRGRFGTMYRVTDIATGKSVVCRLSDRGPFRRRRIIDLSRGLAAALGILGRGVANVRVEEIPN